MLELAEAWAIKSMVEIWVRYPTHRSWSGDQLRSTRAVRWSPCPDGAAVS